MMYLKQFCKRLGVNTPAIDRLIGDTRLDDRWITMNNARVLLGDDGEVKGGLGGKYTGQNVSAVGGKPSSEMSQGIKDEMSHFPAEMQELTKHTYANISERFSEYSSTEGQMRNIFEGASGSVVLGEGDYGDMQNQALKVIRENRGLANSLNEYFDSDTSLANAIIGIFKNGLG